MNELLSSSGKFHSGMSGSTCMLMDCLGRDSMFPGSLTGIPSFLASCLPRQEMDSLQRQMEAHTVTVHESLSSWTQGDPTAIPAPPGDHTNPRGDTELHSQSRTPREGLEQ